MNDLLRLALGLMAGTLLLVPLYLTLSALFPRRLARARAAAEQMPGRASLVGLINLLFFTAVGLALSGLADLVRNELPRLPALLVLGALALAVTIGLAAVAELVGARLWPTVSAPRRLAAGTLALGLGSAFPVVGWFGLLPYAACLGLGAFILSFFLRERPAAPPEAERLPL